MTRYSFKTGASHWRRLCAAATVVSLALGITGGAHPPQVRASGLPALTLAATGPSQVAYGSHFSYSFTFQNAGAANAGPVIFRYVIPAGVTYVSYTDAGGTFDGCLPWGRLLTCFASELAVGDAGTLVLNFLDTFNPTATTSISSTGWWVPIPTYPSMNYGSAYATITSAFLSGTITPPTATPVLPTPTVTPVLPTATSTPVPTTTTYQATSGSVSPSLVIQMNFSGGGSATLNPVLGPNCYLGMTCGFPSGYIGTYMSYTLADGSSATFTNFHGTFYPTGGDGYALSGQASGTDSTGRSVTVSSVQATMTIFCRSGRGGGCTKTFNGGTMTLTR